MAQPDNAGAYQACLLRLAREAADGSTPAGATNGLILKEIITIGMTPEVDEGQDFAVTTACGEKLYANTKDKPLVVRWNMTLSLANPNPEAAELLTGAALILSTPAAARTPTLTTVSGSTTLSGAAFAATSADVGATLSGTGVAVGSVIEEILSTTSVRMSLAATASGSVTVTVTPVAQAIGSEDVPLGIQPTSTGTSFEFWERADGTYLPYWRHAVTRTYWRQGDKQFANARRNQDFVGYAVENLNWGNGPWNDWRADSPSAFSLSRAHALYRVATLPTYSNSGYVAVPTQA